MPEPSEPTKTQEFGFHSETNTNSRSATVFPSDYARYAQRDISLRNLITSHVVALMQKSRVTHAGIWRPTSPQTNAKQCKTGHYGRLQPHTTARQLGTTQETRNCRIPMTYNCSRQICRVPVHYCAYIYIYIYAYVHAFLHIRVYIHIRI